MDVSTFNEYSGVVDTKLEEKALQSDLEALSGVVENLEARIVELENALKAINEKG